MTGKYIAAAHRSCNLQHKPSPWLSVFMHNLTSYDHHPILCALGHEEIRSLIQDVYVLPISSEKFTVFNIITKTGAKIRFADSLRFLNSSLDSLCTAVLGNDDLHLLQSHFHPHHDLLRRKQIFCYDHLSSFAVLDEPSLPPRSAFRNSITSCDISEQDYKHAQLVFKTLRCRTMADYVKVYLWVDVILLAEIFQRFRRLCNKPEFFSLDPCHYVSMPQLAFDAALLSSGDKLELLTDIDQILFFKAGVRGGVSMICKRYSHANNPLMQDDYDATTEEDTYILYHDVNNLYGGAMSFPLPTNGFNWLPTEQHQFIIETILNLSAKDSHRGYVLEVDLEYPDELHDDHNDLPLAPEKIHIDGALLSPFQQGYYDGNRPKTRKLIPHFFKRSNYIIHYITLRYYLRKGLKVTAIHRVLTFCQEPWLKQYIHDNTERRKKEQTTFGKDLYKLMNNAVYGKTLENVWERKEVHICYTEEMALQFAEKPWFTEFKIMGSSLSLFIMKKKRVQLDKPFYLGFSILDISKFMFYSNWYDGYKKLWGSSVKMLMCDTDSYIMEVTVPSSTELTPYKDLQPVAENSLRSRDTWSLQLDTSSFNKEDERAELQELHWGGKRNTKVLGAVKDEMGGNIIFEFAGLTSKMYAFRYIVRDMMLRHSESVLKAKGVPKRTLKESFNFDSYKSMLFEDIRFKSADYVAIRSKNHQIQTIRETKKCLSNTDDKRYIVDAASFETITFGHKCLRQPVEDTDGHDPDFDYDHGCYS